MNKSCRYNDEFLTFKDRWINKLGTELISRVNHLEGAIKSNDRMVYRDGKEIPSLNTTVIFHIDKGEIFKQTVAFEIYLDAEMDMAVLSERYTSNKKSFAKNDVKKIADFIIENVTNQIVDKTQKKMLKIK